MEYFNSEYCVVVNPNVYGPKNTTFLAISLLFMVLSMWSEVFFVPFLTIRRLSFMWKAELVSVVTKVGSSVSRVVSSVCSTKCCVHTPRSELETSLHPDEGTVLKILWRDGRIKSMLLPCPTLVKVYGNFFKV